MKPLRVHGTCVHHDVLVFVVPCSWCELHIDTDTYVYDVPVGDTMLMQEYKTLRGRSALVTSILTYVPPVFGPQIKELSYSLHWTRGFLNEM